jgi:hypothetical protein
LKGREHLGNLEIAPALNLNVEYIDLMSDHELLKLTSFRGIKSVFLENIFERVDVGFAETSDVGAAAATLRVCRRG